LIADFHIRSKYSLAAANLMGEVLTAAEISTMAFVRIEKSLCANKQF
jgi:hypothetical protein